MIHRFAQQIEKTHEVLERLDAEMQRAGAALWDESSFGELSHEYCGHVETAFEEVVPPRDGPHTISREIEVQSWVFRNPVRSHARTRWGRVKEFARTLSGRYYSAREYWRTVVPQKETRTVTTADTRVPRGSGMTIRQNVTVKVPMAAEARAARSRRWMTFEVACLSCSVSEAWWEAVRKSWRRLWGNADVEAPFEPRLVDQQVAVAIDVPPVQLDELAPAAQAYWKRRWELEAEVRNVTSFLQNWQAHVAGEVSRTQQLSTQAASLAASVAALPRPIEGQQKLLEIQRRMEVSEQTTAQHVTTSNELRTRLQLLVDTTLAVRGESLGP